MKPSTAMMTPHITGLGMPTNIIASWSRFRRRRVDHRCVPSNARCHAVPHEAAHYRHAGAPLGNRFDRARHRHRSESAGRKPDDVATVDTVTPCPCLIIDRSAQFLRALFCPDGPEQQSGSGWNYPLQGAPLQSRWRNAICGAPGMGTTAQLSYARSLLNRGRGRASSDRCATSRCPQPAQKQTETTLRLLQHRSSHGCAACAPAARGGR